MTTWFSDKVEKRGSNIEGLGLFCVSAIAPGETVVVKGGHVFDRRTRDELAETLGPAEIQIDDHLFIGPITQEERDASMMCLNHSCNPNVQIVGQITFRAIRDIEVGEELTFDYATGDDDDWQMDCACGSVGCRGQVSGKDWQIPELQRRYAGRFADYLERKMRQPGH
ncbi:SET domain-containing protein-lysine N-methyltransferase [Psychromarinibacter sp. C21-152]|uniref:SET domain-containing protein-lysine N-methyltransferase n=1 Tax=Psychromarinibacter sediminicola TaxID=3033385 RepID=A0AAE3NWC7_9RHOB|nr:SET domain-containing protein-lysine N-methyltransferase [Psychromarinibacter sediminicola]MDF0601847.1 SET domain-containing protein-lysine N-methyltransferase [Psychromarinibacter sediminicola]